MIDFEVTFLSKWPILRSDRFKWNYFRSDWLKSDRFCDSTFRSELRYNCNSYQIFVIIFIFWKFLSIRTSLEINLESFSQFFSCKRQELIRECEAHYKRVGGKMGFYFSLFWWVRWLYQWSLQIVKNSG